MADETKDLEVKKTAQREMSEEEMRKESARLELEIKRAEFKDLEFRRRERELNLQDVEQRVSARELVQLQREADRKQKAKTFAADEKEDRTRQNSCSHRKGGLTSPQNMQVLKTGGDDYRYAVIKHVMISGDLWVRCQRCSKTWKPPVESDFFMRNGISVAPKDGKFDEIAFAKAQAEYELAKAFPTNNTTSQSVICRFTLIDNKTGVQSDGTKFYRELTRGSNLR